MKSAVTVVRSSLAEGIRTAIEHPKALNEDFNISTEVSTTVKELAEVIWKKMKGEAPLKLVHDEPYIHDVQMRVPDCSKAKELLGYEAKTSLNDLLDKVIPWVREQVKFGTI